jgi:hemerythrin-like domain-containing protein
MDRFASVTEYLSWDHDRLDGLLEDAAKLAASGQFGDARRRFAELDDGLRRHIRLEEDVLFPVFERRGRMGSGPVHVMLMEHRAIEATMTRMKAALAEDAAGPFAEAREDLLAVLGPHNEKEERILYPTTDDSLSSDELGALVRQLQAF